MGSKVIAIDMDGVIHRYSKGWFDGTLYDEPVEGAREKIQMLLDNGFEPVIFTTRTNRRIVRQWLKKYGFPKLRITNRKEAALAYIDDRAIRFTNWEDVIKYFL